MSSAYADGDVSSTYADGVEGTAGLNIAAGEEVRWLPRRRASDLRLPGNDFWLLDELTGQHHDQAGGDTG
jgi:Family of unknown function (DUF6879)